MFRRTLPPVALTVLALVALAFALNRPAERLDIAIDRAERVPIEGRPDRSRVVVEGRAINPRATYRQAMAATLFIEPPNPGGPGLPPSPSARAMTFDPATGRFQIQGVFDPGSFRIEVYDTAGRTYSRPLTFDP